MTNAPESMRTGRRSKFDRLNGSAKCCKALGGTGAWLICWIALVLLQPIHLLAGHDLMVHLAIYNDGPFETDQVPAVFGVPLPSSDDPVDPKDLILVGADTWQIKPLSHWPNGSIRWMLVEAIVNVQPNQDRAAFHLTTGQAPEEQPLIASESSDGFVLDTGKCRIRISGTVEVICHISQSDDKTGQVGAIHLPQVDHEFGELKERTLTLENNGPVTATITLIETYTQYESTFTYTKRFRAYKDQDVFSIESTLLRQPSSRKTLSLPFPSLKTTTSEEGLIQIRTYGETQSSTNDTSKMAPGAMRRMWHTISLPSAGETSPLPLRPFLGRAISINTYNDAHCTEAFVTAGTGNAGLNLQELEFSRFQAAQFIRDIMGGKLLPTPSNYQSLTEWMQNWTPEVETGLLDTPTKEDLMDSMEYDDAWRIPSLWYFMTGESIFKDLRMNDARNQKIGGIDLRKAHRLWDTYMLNGSLEIRKAIADRLSHWFGTSRNIVTSGTPRHLFRMIANLIHQGGLEQKERDIWLDRMESLVQGPRNPRQELNDLFFTEGYRLTGETSYLREGKQWLEQTYDEIPKNNAISGLIQNIQRQHIWRWQELTVTDLGEEGWELSWNAPKNAIRYRFKHYDRTITNLEDENIGTSTMTFDLAENLDMEVVPSAPETRQTVVVSKNKTGDNTHFAMRYLERGPDLPALKSSTENGSAAPIQQSTTQTAQPRPKTYADFIMIGLLVVGLGLAFIAWKKFI